MYDYVIIGAGIAGLYFAYRCGGNAIVLERDQEVGGRTKTVTFHGVTIQPGAGGGVVGKEEYLFKLLLDLDVPFKTGMLNYESEEGQKLLSKLYASIGMIKPEMSFQKFMESVLDEEEQSTFRYENGYTDMYQADALMTMIYYALDENCSKYMVMWLNWSQLIQRLVSCVNVCTNCEAQSITGTYGKFKVATNLGEYECKQVVVATSISTVTKLLKEPIYDRVRAHPFLRVYATFSGDSLEKMKTFEHITKVGGYLHFIGNVQQNVYLVAYTDGDDALSLLEDLESKEGISKQILATTNLEVKVDDAVYFFWPEGVHYYTPGGLVDFKKLRRPRRGIYVIGEAVAESQGWVGGALETVEDVLS